MTRPLSHRRNERYSIDWRDFFAEHYRPLLKPDMVVLDVGSGRMPVLSPHERPAQCTYIGLDISADELQLASSGSYDEVVIGDIVQPQPDLSGRVDLAIANQVLEHIANVPRALDTIHQSLKDGGHFVARLSGRNAHFAIINRMIPEPLGKSAMKRLLGREPDSVFRAHYDHCTYSSLHNSMESWRSVSIEPLYAGGGYLSFSRTARSAYLFYEDWIARTGRVDLASHYIVVAQK